MKIQINSLSALERLIGGDTELEIEIRNSVVDNFTKKHLKSIANDQLVKNSQECIADLINSNYFIKSGYTWSSNISLSENGKSLLLQQFGAIIHGMVAKKFQESEPLELLNKSILDVRDNILSQIETTVLTNKINELVDAKIRSILEKTNP